MKTFQKLVLFFFLFSLVGNSPAQTKKSNEYLELARKSYLRALDSENRGVRNSTIFQIVKFKERYPRKNFKPFLKKLKKMSQHDLDFLNRLHAYMAHEFLTNPKLANALNPSQFQDSHLFFTGLYAVLTNKQLAME
ncbi:MAG: hypothetical protein ACT6FF_09810 [Methanosarcinaceae archaeon]